MELRTPPDHFKMHLQERNILPLEDQCSIDTAGALLVVLESIRTCSFRYRFYATLPEAQEQLETYTGVVYKFDKDRCRLTGETDCSPGDRFDLRVPSTWRCAWAVSMIRWNTGLLNCHFLSCHAQPLSERLMRRGIMPGDAADNALEIGGMMEANYILVTKEGTWYYFYGFRTESEAVHAMLEWFFTDSIVFAVDVTKGDLVEEVRSRCMKWSAYEMAASKCWITCYSFRVACPECLIRGKSSGSISDSARTESGPWFPASFSDSWILVWDSLCFLG